MSNINYDYIEEYIKSTIPPRGEGLESLEKYALENSVPIVDLEVAQLLKFVLKIHKPKKILEVGTAIGYSSILMAKSSASSKIVTIERSPEMYTKAVENVKKFGLEDRIEIIFGDAEEELPKLKDSFDFVFLDASKGHYLEFFKYIEPLLEDDSVIFSDNILFKGMVATDQLVKRRKKTIVKRMRSYIEYINDLEGYTTSTIPIGDGVALTYKEGVINE